MKTAIRALFVATTLLTAPSAVAPVLSQAADRGAPSAHGDLVRVPAASEGATMDLAQALGPPDPADGAGAAGRDGGGHFMAWRAGALFWRHMMAPLPPRQACLERIDRHVGIVAYFKSKLQLRADQKDAWRKIEEAAEPHVQALREVCAQLPDRADARPTLPDMIDIGEKATTAGAALLHAIREPVRQLYEQLTPDQRAALVPPMTMRPGAL